MKHVPQVFIKSINSLGPHSALRLVAGSSVRSALLVSLALTPGRENHRLSRLVCFDQFSDRFSSKCGATYLNLGHNEANIFIFLRTPKNPTIIGAFVRNLWQNSPQNFPVLPPSAILFISGFCTCALRQQGVCCSSVSA